MSGLEVGATLAIIGGVKWIYETLGQTAEAQKLVAKLERLAKKYDKADQRTNESKAIRDKLMMVKGMIMAKKGGEASHAVDGILAMAGLA